MDGWMGVPSAHAERWTWTRRSTLTLVIDKEGTKVGREGRHRRDDGRRGRDGGAWPWLLNSIGLVPSDEMMCVWSIGERSSTMHSVRVNRISWSNFQKRCNFQTR